MNFKNIKRLFLLLLLSYLFPWIYSGLSQLWCDQGGSSSTLNKFEFPYILLLCVAFYFNPDKGRKIFSKFILFPPCTIIGVYVLYDFFYLFYKRSPRLSDFDNFFSLFHVSPLLFFSLNVYLALLITPTLYAFYLWKQDLGLKSLQRNFYAAIRCCLIVVILAIPGTATVYSYQLEHLHFDSWSDTRNVEKNGRVGSFIYYHNKRKEVLQRLKSENGVGASYSHFYPSSPISKRNIHIIVLESFVDPRLIRGLTFSVSPLSQELVPFMVEREDFSLIQMPVYGGGSPQSEFEILTGLPAFAKIASIEFNVFEGGKSSSFIQKLSDLGYGSMVAKGSKAGFYNSTNAYVGLGFSEIHYREKSYYRRAGGDDYLFDGDLLEANLGYLEKQYYDANNQKPFVNYVVGMYGHLPFSRNIKVRPDMVKINKSDVLLYNLTNQFYYRTEALGKFLKRLQKLDPQALVFITSDHLPPIFQKGRKYLPKNHRLNIALLLDGFKPVDISDTYLHQISHIIWKRLVAHPQNSITAADNYPEDLLESIYLSLMREAIQPKS